MIAPALPFPVTSLRFWRAFGVTMRPYLMFVSGASGLVGLALAESLHGAVLLAAALPFFVSYGLGQAVTDTFQTDTDALSSPYRPLVRGEITCTQVRIVSFASLAFVALLLALLNPWALAPAALAVAGVTAYTPFKRRWWAGPPWNSWVVALLPLIGVLLGGGTPLDALARTEVWLAMGSVYFTYAVFVLLGYFKDVEADRATGYDTMVVRFGRRAALWVSGLHVALGTACSLGLVGLALQDSAYEWSSVIGVVLWGIGVGGLVTAQHRMARTSRDDEAYGPIAIVVVAYVALHLGEAALLRPAFAPAALLLLPLAMWMLAHRPEKTQV
ncbi:MAG TPA: UbiA family prenyltransferase [Burkholderiaceae bacterium]|nr:UbiA family prenyltransferase [Burkholderiaceae bacterium]HQR71044.1 UbiA family prenyltransferase [Burkholderiaceae bacterium]